MDFARVSSVSVSRLSSSPILQALPFIRLPLAVNNLVTIILAGFQINGIKIAEIVFLGLSLLLTFIVIGRSYKLKRCQAIKLEDDDAALKFHSSGFLVMADFALVLPFFILHIVGSVSFRGSQLTTYAAVGAFVAWVIHLVLAIAEGHLWMKRSGRRRATKTRCPQCNSRTSRVETPELNVEEAVQNRLEPRARDAKIDFEALVNETGEGEGDRLILTSADEE